MSLNNESAILDQVNDGIYFVDRNRVITMWNKAAERITGFTANEVVGKSCSENILNHIDKDGNKLCLSLCPLAATMSDESPRESELFLHHKDGHRVPVLVRTSPHYKDGECVGGIELFTDINRFSLKEQRMKELEQLALIDSLTEIANRYYITQQLESSFEEYRRYGLKFGILFFDIDFFKKFNDTYGHEMGDRVLKLVSRTINRNMRAFDIIGRWGGEEFIAIIRNVDDSQLFSIANRFRTLVENSFVMHNNQTIEVTVSVGATMVIDSDTPESIRMRADSLMYKSKEQGRNRVSMG